MTFWFRALNEAEAVVATVQQIGAKVLTEDGIETWSNESVGYVVPGAGWVQVGIQILISVSPNTYLWFPLEDASAPDWDKAKRIRVIDPSGATSITSVETLVVGWPADGG